MSQIAIRRPSRAHMSAAATTVAQRIRLNRNADAWLFATLLAVTLVVTPLISLGSLAAGSLAMLAVLIAIPVIVLLVLYPVSSVYLLAVCTVVIEQEPLAYSIFTDKLYVFSWPAKFAGLPERPIGFLVLLALVVYVAKGIASRRSHVLRGGALLGPFLFFMACVVVGVLHGLASGGNYKIVILEVRPLWYLFLAYLTAYNVIRTKRDVQIFLWITVAGTAFKALQGVYIIYGPLHGHYKGQNEIMAHEQSYFFVLILLLVLLCLLLGRQRALMWTSIASLPFLILSLVANNRRADYLAFGLGAVAAYLFVVAIRPHARKRLLIILAVTVTILGLYIGIFGTIHTPISSFADSLISVVHPSATDTRDILSNLYRDFENYDLQFTESQSPIIGYGFGKPFLEPKVLIDIVTLDPYYLYIPHNNILWIWMRLGPIGFVALWYLFAAFIMRSGVIIKKLRDPDLQLFAIFSIGAMIIEIPLAYGDYQLFFYRNVLYIGMLMGIVMRLPELDQAPADETQQVASRKSPRTNRLSRRGPERHENEVTGYLGASPSEIVAAAKSIQSTGRPSAQPGSTAIRSATARSVSIGSAPIKRRIRDCWEPPPLSS